MSSIKPRKWLLRTCHVFRRQTSFKERSSVRSEALAVHRTNIKSGEGMKYSSWWWWLQKPGALEKNLSGWRQARWKKGQRHSRQGMFWGHVWQRKHGDWQESGCCCGMGRVGSCSQGEQVRRDWDVKGLRHPVIRLGFLLWALGDGTGV